LFPYLLSVIRHFVTVVGARALIVCTVRNERTVDEFVELLGNVPIFDMTTTRVWIGLLQSATLQ
jgi:hypothetical protein